MACKPINLPTTGNMLKKLIKQLVALLTLSSILLPQFTLAANTHTTSLVTGSNQGFTVADSADFGWGSNSTIQFWVKLASLPTNNGDPQMTFLAQSTADNRWGTIGYYQDAGVLKFAWHSYNHCSDTGLTETNARITYTLSTGVWYHLAYVKTSTTWEMFVDKVSVGTATIDNSGDCGAQWNVGFAQNQLNGLDGQMDDFRIYPTVARTAAQISADYNCELADYTNLTVYYQFNNAATEVAGVGSATDDLTAVNTPTYQTASLPFTAACGGGGAAAAPTHPLIWNLF